MMCISLFSYGRPVVVRCKGVGLGMGWVGSFIWWVGLGWVDENRPTDNYGTAGLEFILTKSRFVCFTLLMPDTKLRPTSVQTLATAELHMHGVIVMTFPFSNVNILYSVSEMSVWKDKQ